MHSKKLNQVIRVELDTAAMRGPVNRRDIAERVYSIVHDSPDYWSLADKRDALVNAIFDGVVDAMDERITPEHLHSILPRVPAKFQHLLEKMPTFICINASAGLHVLSVNATQEDWAASAKLKSSIAERVKSHADIANDIRMLLASEGAQTLADLGERAAA